LRSGPGNAVAETPERTVELLTDPVNTGLTAAARTVAGRQSEASMSTATNPRRRPSRPLMKPSLTSIPHRRKCQDSPDSEGRRRQPT
jgi:hypothetical protein